MNKKTKKYCILIGAALLLLSALVTLSAIYINRNVNRFPECNSIVNIKTNTYSSKLFIHISSVSNSEVSISVNGKVYSNSRQFDVSNVFIFNYLKMASDFRFNLIKLVSKKTEVPREIQPQILSSFSDVALFKIESIDKDRFMFIDNFSPLFVCQDMD